MRCIIDTHALLWSLGENARLSDAAKRAIVDSDDALVSIASLWEIAIKQSIGKLEVKGTIQDMVRECIDNGYEILPITPEHLDALCELPPVHKDPFDRLLVAQAMCTGAQIVTKDERISDYEVATVW